MNLHIKEGLEDAAGLLSAGVGIVGGTITGAVEAAFLPSYISSRTGRGFSLFTLIAESLEEHLQKGQYNTTLEKISTTNFVAAFYATRTIARWTAVVAVFADLTDGTADNAGYAAIPMAVSLVYEVGKAVKKRIDTNNS